MRTLESGHAANWTGLARMGVDAQLAARIMGCTVGTAVKRLRQASFQARNADAIAEAVWSRDVLKVSARQCGLECIEVAVSEADDSVGVGGGTAGEVQERRRCNGAAHGKARRDVGRVGELPRRMAVVLGGSMGRLGER